MFNRLLELRYAPHRSWKALATLPVFGLLLALAGPFGSYANIDFWARCAHFTFCFTLIGFLILESSYRLSRTFFAGRLPIWMAILLDLALAIPAATAVYGSLWVFARAVLPYIRFADLIWQNYLITIVARAGILGAALLRDNRTRQTDVDTMKVEVGDDFPLGALLPSALKDAPLLALSSEDHYLRVYTRKGEALVHLTITEAIALIGGGFQIHRSHWINDGTVKLCKGSHVELITGQILPISRYRRKGFEAWLANQ